MTVQAVGIFCEDIREEKSGQDTLIGILPDNLLLSVLPSSGPKLGVYVRLTVDPKDPPKFIVGRVKTPWGPERDFELGHADADVIGASVENALKNGLPIAGIVMKATLIPFLIPASGQVVITIAVDEGLEYVCGVLNLIAPNTASGNLPPH